MFPAAHSFSQTSVPPLDSLLSIEWISKGNKFSSKPLVHNGLVFETFNLQYALRTENGERLYFSNHQHQSLIRTLTKDSVVVFSSDMGLSVLDIYSGSVIYESFNRIKRPWTKVPGYWGDENFYTALDDTTFIAFSLKSRRVIWKKKLPTVIFNLPIIRGDTIYLADKECLYVLDKHSGKELQKYELGEIISNTHVIGDILYAWIQGKGLIAMSISTGAVLWTFNDSKYKQMYFELLFDRDIIYLYSKELYALSRHTGRVIWSNQGLKSRETYTLGLTKKYILAFKKVDDRATLVACRKTDGKIIYAEFQPKGEFLKFISPSLDSILRFGSRMHGNFIYAVDLNGNIYCLRVREDG